MLFFFVCKYISAADCLLIFSSIFLMTLFFSLPGCYFIKTNVAYFFDEFRSSGVPSCRCRV